MTEPLRTTVHPAARLDVRRTLSALRRGGADPRLRFAPDGIWWAVRTPGGAATLHLVQRADGDVAAAAWGPGAEHALDGLPAAVGARDEAVGWCPTLPLLRDLDARSPGLRVPRTTRVLEELVPAILEQKVTGHEARRSWMQLLRRYGEPAPGPGGELGLRVPPAPAVLAQLTSWQWHQIGVEQKRAMTIRRAAEVAGRLEQCAELPLDAAQRRMRAVPGVGPWTVAEVSQRALGDPDAVSVGDFHLPNLVGWMLAGRARSTDEEMLELLAAYRPHRYRVVRLLELSGMHAPRFGPRYAPRDIRAI